MRARPVFECSPYAEDFSKQLEAFREDERAWFEEVVANPNVQEVLRISADEPVNALDVKNNKPTSESWCMCGTNPNEFFCKKCGGLIPPRGSL